MVLMLVEEAFCFLSVFRVIWQVPPECSEKNTFGKY